MKLAFSGEARHPDYTKGYRLYLNRSRKDKCLDEQTYKRVVRRYCSALANRLFETGMADLPGLGTVVPAILRRKAQYRGNKFVGLGKMDWEKGHMDGSFKAFGMVFLPDRSRTENLRCYGFVANRKLFRKMKDRYLADDCPWIAMDYDDKMI